MCIRDRDTSGRGVSAQSMDINLDQRPDLLVSNDLGSPSKLFINQGGMRFQDVSADYGVASSSSQRAMLASRDREYAGIQLLVGGNDESPPSFFELVESRFQEVSSNGSLAELPESTQAIAIGDFNLDGIQDYYLANGILFPNMDQSSYSQGQSNRMLLGRPDGSFTDCDHISGQEGCFPDRLISLSNRRVVVEDFDQDGDLDIYETANNDLGRYLENQIVSAPQKEYSSLFRLDSPKVRLELIKWLLDEGSLNIATKELALLTIEAQDAIAVEAISLLGSIIDPSALEPIMMALRSQSSRVREAGVLALRQQEVDYTGRYFIPLLRDPSDSVRCAAADSFSRFFEEEEAMIRSKHLASAELVRIAGELQGSILPCLVTALGKSESYRALQPLLDLVASAEEEIRIAAIQSLGVLKEQEATPILLELSKNTDESSNVREQAELSLQLLLPKGELTDSNSRKISALAYQQINHIADESLAVQQDLGFTTEECAVSQIQNIDSNSRPLLSDYRRALALYEDENSVTRFCIASVLMAYDPDRHLDELEQFLLAVERSETEQLMIAAAIYRYNPERLWFSVLKDNL